MAKNYYNNLLASQNVTARSNLVWTADITKIVLNDERKIYTFLCIDIHTNTIITYCSSIKTITASAIVIALSKDEVKELLNKIIDNMLYNYLKCMEAALL